MAPKTRAMSAKAGAKDPNPKQTLKPKLYITRPDNESKNTKRCGHCGTSVRSEGTETTLQDTTNAAANVSAELLDSIQPAEPRESIAIPSPAELTEWNETISNIRRRTARSESFSILSIYYTHRRRSAMPTEDVKLEVADSFRSRWASMSDDERVAATALVQMKNDPNYQSAPVPKKTRSPRRKLTGNLARFTTG